MTTVARALFAAANDLCEQMLAAADAFGGDTPEVDAARDAWRSALVCAFWQGAPIGLA